MRDGAWKKVAGFSAALLAWAGIGQAWGQIPGEYRDPRDAEIASLRAELDRYEDISTRLTALETTSLADEKVDAAAEDKGGPTKVNLIVKPAFNVRGRIFFDHINYENDIAPLFDETGFDTIRIGVFGPIYENVKAQVEVEFEGEETDYKDCYIELNELGYTGYNLRVGYFKEPFSMEELTSSVHDLFMEQSISTNSNNGLVPSRSFGLMAYDYFGDTEDASWYTGIFRENSRDDTQNRGTIQDDNGAFVWTSRIAVNPYYDEPNSGRCLCHVGGAYSWRNAPQAEDAGTPPSGVTDSPNRLAFGSKQALGSQTGYLFVNIVDDEYHLLGGELAWQNGPVGAMAEYYAALPEDGGYFWGSYVECWYFLTGENRGYKRNFKVWDRVKPFEDFFCVRTADGVCKGCGAWQAKARYDYLDLDSDDVTLSPTGAGTFGHQQAVTIGANWFLNPYTRMMFDYVWNDVQQNGGPSGEANFFGTRFQVDF